MAAVAHEMLLRTVDDDQAWCAFLASNDPVHAALAVDRDLSLAAFEMSHANATRASANEAEKQTSTRARCLIMQANRLPLFKPYLSLVNVGNEAPR